MEALQVFANFCKFMQHLFYSILHVQMALGVRCDMRAVRCKCKTAHFLYSRSQDIAICVSFDMQVAKKPNYPVMCRFALHSTNVMDGRPTDAMLVA